MVKTMSIKFNRKLRLTIILVSLLIGVFAVLDSCSDSDDETPVLDDDETKARLARFVADLFEEDIPFDDLEKQKKAGLRQMEKQQDQYNEDHE